jgi:cytochrome c
MSKQRYQPFDGLHIGLAKTNGNRVAARAFFSWGGCQPDNGSERNEVDICCGHGCDRDDSGCARTRCGRRRAVIQKCLPCHAVGEGAKNKVGPELNGLDGRHSGSAPDYNYTDANKNSGINWSEATFKDYIKDPRAKIPNTKMIFPGIKNEKEAGDLWAYLKQFDAGGKKK